MPGHNSLEHLSKVMGWTTAISCILFQLLYVAGMRDLMIDPRSFDSFKPKQLKSCDLVYTMCIAAAAVCKMPGTYSLISKGRVLLKPVCCHVSACL